MDLELLNGSMNILNIFKIIKFRLDFAKEHPDYFVPERIINFLWFSRVW